MLYNLFRKSDNISTVSWKLLKHLDVNINFDSLIEILQNHPNNDSLLSIVDSLNQLGVSTECYHIPVDSYDRDDLLFPFIAHFESDEKFLSKEH